MRGIICLLIAAAVAGCAHDRPLVSDGDAGKHVTSTMHFTAYVEQAVLTTTGAEQFPALKQQISNGHDPASLVVTRDRAKQIFKAGVDGYWWAGVQKRNEQGEMATFSGDYPDFPTGTPYNRPFQRTSLGLDFTAEPTDKANVLAARGYPRIEVSPEGERDWLTCSLGHAFEAGLNPDQSLVLYLGVLSELDRRIPDATIREALRHDDRASFGESPDFASGVEAIANEDRSQRHVFLLLTLYREK